jgi:multidrug transporter EmrE-like cation transporter
MRRRVYFDSVLSEPIMVLKIYLKKFGMSLIVTAGYDLRNLAKGSVTIVILLTSLVWLPRSIKGDETIVALGIWAGFGTVMLQGVLALPSGIFISPGKLGALCGIFVLVEAAGRTIAMRAQEKVGGMFEISVPD